MSFPTRSPAGISLAIVRGLVFGALLPFWVLPGQAQIIIDPPARSNAPPVLRLLAPSSNRWARVWGDHYSSNAPAQIYLLQRSSNLREWRDAAQLLGTPFNYLDPASAGTSQSFYRMLLRPATDDDDWANQLSLPSLMVNEEGCEQVSPLGWVKFAIVLGQPDRVYFQDTRKYVLHYPFATRRLAPFLGMSAEQFNGVSLRTAGQQVVLGIVLVPRQSAEVGIQFVGQDPYPAESVARWLELVRSALDLPYPRECYYIPTYEQSETAWAQQAWFAARGIPLASLDRWSSRPTTVYAPGWALGRLVFVPAAEIPAAYADGRLQPTDILLTDVVPAEVPYVAGIISLASATPASHVAILAANYGIPFFSVTQSELQRQVLAMANEIVAVRTGLSLTSKTITVTRLLEDLAPAQRAQVASMRGLSFQVTPKARYGSYAASTEGLTADDLRYFGGKASHFGLLRRTIPTYSPAAVAYSFDLWDDFMDQPLRDGRTLRATIQSLLQGYPYPPNIPALRASLAAVRDLIRDGTLFTPAQQDAIVGALADFDPLRKIRVRSSTNVEDNESFTGAGLYDSFSGCLADDFDPAARNTCWCDPTEKGERGIFRAIRKVYASFYNENAFLERLRLGLSEHQVGMALLAHYSAPDETELANGVVTVSIFSTNSCQGEIVLQPGAASVTNPDNTAAPEMVGFDAFAGQFGVTNLTLRQGSALLPRGAQAMNWMEDYQQLVGLVFQVAQAYQRQGTNQGWTYLDLEFKKLVPGQLLIKQVREMPALTGSQTWPTVLLSGNQVWLVRPGTAPGLTEDFSTSGTFMAMHRLKSLWECRARNLIPKLEGLTQPCLAEAKAQFFYGDPAFSLAGSPANWSGASHTITNRLNTNLVITLDHWTAAAGSATAEFALRMELPLIASATESPWRQLADLSLGISVSYPEPKPVLGGAGQTMGVTNESVLLFPYAGTWADVLTAPTNAVHRQVTTNSLSITTTVPWIPALGDDTADPCGGLIWGGGRQFQYVGGAGETIVEGLLDVPLILRSYAAQTYWMHGRTGHETVEEVILDPWLEPDLPVAVQAVLTARNIRLLQFRSYYFGDLQLTLRILGLDGVFRDYVR